VNDTAMQFSLEQAIWCVSYLIPDQANINRILYRANHQHTNQILTIFGTCLAQFPVDSDEESWSTAAGNAAQQRFPNALV